ncbi:MAG: group II intron reverse transcriptase domain-containing protein [Candidatus Vogelbacteria bacterium]|nr:group II intron reverse transcriptase domain-containing protein [Candidatus Vogelbacteria bacterium]
MLTHKYEDIITIENLLLSWNSFLKGKRHKKDVIKFEAELATNILDLHNSLKQKTYTHGGYTAFNISDPKPRNIHKASVRDRLLHHVIYKDLYWYFHSRFIYDSYSCRLEKGTHRALNRFRYFARKVSRNHTNSCFVLKCDIKKFFASVDHAILIKILKHHIADPDIIWLINQVISSFQTTRPGVGLPLGNLTSQLLVNVYMHEFDMYLKQELRIKYYLRYADDFVILSDNRNYLENILPQLHTFLNEKLGLTLHENKVYIKTYYSGVDFLGWVHFPHHRQIRTTTKRKIIRKMKSYPKRETISSYRGLLEHGNAYKFKKQLGLVE